MTMKNQCDDDKLGLKAYFHTENVFLFVPNIIGYVRILFLCLFAFLSFTGSNELAVVCYIISVALDEVDGNSARYLNQTSLFGMLLDIMIDEVTVLCICCLLGTLYPRYIIYFQCVTIVDIVGQWSNYQQAAMLRVNDYTRKGDWILNIYFNNKVFTNLWVYGNHVFLLTLFMCSFTTGVPIVLFGHEVGLWKLVACLAAPWSMSRSLLMLYLLILSMSDIARHDAMVYRHESRRHQNGVTPCTTEQVQHNNSNFSINCRAS